MKILVLNGSPAGKNSITLQTVEYLKICFPDHSYEVLQVGKQIRSMEKDFSAAREKLEDADLIRSAIRYIPSWCRRSCTGLSN